MSAETCEAVSGECERDDKGKWGDSHNTQDQRFPRRMRRLLNPWCGECGSTKVPLLSSTTAYVEGLRSSFSNFYTRNTQSTVGGIGGGGLFIPILTIIAGQDVKIASTYSAFMVTGGSIANVMRSKRLIDYDMALVCQPSLLLGVSCGVVLNVVFLELLEYYGIKEQETAVIELQNHLRLNTMEAKLYNLKIESLLLDNRRLEAQAADHANASAELEAAKGKIKMLRKKLKSDTD